MSSLNGTSDLIKYFQQLEKDIQEDVLDVVEETTLNIQREAIMNAPAAGDNVPTQYGTQKVEVGINQYIGSKLEDNGLSGTVFLEAGATKLAIFIEYGTGSSAAGYVPTLPKEWQEHARKYYVNGKGTLLKKPFMLPAYFKYEVIFVNELKKIVSKKR